MSHLTYKRAAGIELGTWKGNASSQRNELPDSGLAPSNAEMCDLLRDYLWKKDLERISGTGKMPMFPMVFQDGVCTGEPMTLMRVCSRIKIKDGKEVPNGNFGRFFVANKEPRPSKDPEQDFELNDKGFPILDLVDFCWFEETPFVRHGALRAVAPHLENLILNCHGTELSDDDFWPTGLEKRLI